MILTVGNRSTGRETCPSVTVDAKTTYELVKGIEYRPQNNEEGGKKWPEPCHGLPFVVKSQQKYRRDMKIHQMSDQLLTGDVLHAICFVHIRF